VDVSGPATRGVRARRIVYVWDADYPWDVRTEKICLALSQAGHDVHIVARNKAWKAESERLPEGTVHRMRPWRVLGQRADAVLGFPAFFSPRWSRLITQTVREADADLIIVRDLPLCPTAIHVGRRTGVPVILDMAENYPAMMRAIWSAGRARLTDYLVRNPVAVEWIERYCLARVDRVLVVTDMVRDQLLKRGLDAARVEVVGNTPPRAAAAGARGCRPRRDPVEIVYLGIIEIPRGLEELVDATAILRDEGARFRLRLIGDGRDAAALRARAERLRLSSADIEFCGFVPYSEAVDLLRDADIGVLPLHRNPHMDTTIPNKLFDYMAAGLPVVTSDVPASASLVRQTRCGEVFQAGSAVSLRDALMRLSDSDERTTKGENGRQAVLREYHWERDAAVLQDVVRSIHATEDSDWTDAQKRNWA